MYIASLENILSITFLLLSDPLCFSLFISLVYIETLSTMTSLTFFSVRLVITSLTPISITSISTHLFYPLTYTCTTVFMCTC